MAELRKPGVRTNRGFKANAEEWLAIQTNANRFAGGNTSVWIRYAATKLEPKPEDLRQLNSSESRAAEAVAS